MRFLRSFSLLLALCGALASSSVMLAHDRPNHGASAPKPAGELLPASTKDAAWLAHAKAESPTTTCFVSGDTLGEDMGKPVDFIWREPGKPDRLISFCCKDCVKDFHKDPRKYLKELDAAQAAAAAHAGHAH